MNYSSAYFEKAYATKEQLEISGIPEICFSGKSNVGKSSLINKLTNRKNLVRVSNKPGKTVTVNFYRIDDIRLVDLPGYGYAKVSYDEKIRWSGLMEEYFSGKRNIKYVFQLLDMRHKPGEYDLSMIKFLIKNSIPFSVVLTKSDKLNKTDYNEQLSDISGVLNESCGPVDLIITSSVTGTGVDLLKEKIEKSL